MKKSLRLNAVILAFEEGKAETHQIDIVRRLRATPNTRPQITALTTDGYKVDQQAILAALKDIGCITPDHLTRMANWNEDLIRHVFEIDMKLTPADVKACLQFMRSTSRLYTA